MSCSCKESPPTPPSQPPRPRRHTAESLIILPRSGDADITAMVRKATKAEYIEVRDWKEPRRPGCKPDPRKPYAVIYPRLRAALTNAPRENLESELGEDAVAPNFPVELPLPPVDLQQTVIAPTGSCVFDETYDTWARQILQGTGGQNGNGVKVCVVDTGLQADHPDFAGRPLDDVHIQPFNLAGIIDDSYGHGTHCAGIISGPQQPHKAPRYGIAPGVELFVANVFGRAYETTVDTLIDALEWAIARGCHIVSMSLFKPVDPDDNEIMKFRQVFETALDQGTMLLACTGNMSDRASGNVVTARFPSSIPEVLAVGGVTKCLKMLNVSNSGGNVVAPGDYTWSSDHTAFGYTHLEGTSIATAHAAGITALHAQASGKRGRDLLALVKQTANPSPPPTDLDSGLITPP